MAAGMLGPEEEAVHVARTLRYWAVGIGRWVEIRAGTKEPTLKESEVEREGKKRTAGTPEFDINGYYVRTNPRFKQARYKLGVRCWVGGKIVATVSSRRFSKLAKACPSNGGMFELTEEMLSTLKEKKVLK